MSDSNSNNDNNNNNQPELDNFSGMFFISLERENVPAVMVDKHAMFHLYEAISETIASTGFKVKAITGAYVAKGASEATSIRLTDKNLPEFWQACHDDHQNEKAWQQKQINGIKASMLQIQKNDPESLPAFMDNLRKARPELAAEIEGTPSRVNMPGVGFMAAGPKGDQ